MKIPKLKIMPTSKIDKKKAKIMTQVINYHYEQNYNFISTLIQTRLNIEMIYGIKTPEHYWERIMQAHIEEMIK